MHAAARTVTTFTGFGQENAPRFTVSSAWKLVYSLVKWWKHS
jgi:hypothetical protein